MVLLLGPFSNYHFSPTFDSEIKYRQYLRLCCLFVGRLNGWMSCSEETVEKEGTNIYGSEWIL